MAIGYACVTRGVQGAQQRAMRLSSIGDEARFLEVAHANLDALDRILTYNRSRGIQLFRVSSGLIPLASHPDNPHDWESLLAPRFAELRTRVDAAGLRLSMHPGQYTMLDSDRPETVDAALAEVEYAARLLSLLSGGESLIVLHGGGKPDALARGVDLLSPAARGMLVLENDETRSAPEDTLAACRRLGLPMVYDPLHAEVRASRRTGAGRLPANGDPAWAKVHRETTADASQTWQRRARPQKIHVSLQREGPGARPGAHSESIPPRVLQRKLADWGVDPAQQDVMLETKDKNWSATACTLSLLGATRPALEREWAAWKYLVMEHSRSHYDQKRDHFNRMERTSRAVPPEDVLRFYDLVDAARAIPAKPGGTLNALQHVWGYFKRDANDAERAAMMRALRQFSEGGLSRGAVVARLEALAIKYGADYLLDGYYLNER